jgi:hypothetical protein
MMRDLRFLIKTAFVLLTLCVVLFTAGGTGVRSKRSEVSRSSQSIKRDAWQFVEFDDLTNSTTSMPVISASTTTMTAADGGGATPGDEDCLVHDQPEGEQCEYLRKTAACSGEGLIDYLHFQYCVLPNAKWLATTIMIAWLLALLFFLGSTAEFHFCPALSHISETLRLSPDVAGVTILAFGNGVCVKRVRCIV